MKIAALLTFLLLFSSALAGTISLTTSITTETISGNSSLVKIEITNMGDEAAYNTQLSIISDEFSSKPVNLGTLLVNVPYKTNITIESQKELKEGSYALFLITEYTDANGYPFSSVSPISLIYKSHYPSRVIGSFETVEISEKRGKDISLKLRNMDQIPHEVRVRLVLPNELASDFVEKNINVGPKEEKVIKFKVSNFGGLVGSSYVILAAIEYEGDYHYASIATGMVKIVEDKNPLKFKGPLPFIFAGALLIVFILYQFFGKKIEIRFEKNGKKTK